MKLGRKVITTQVDAPGKTLEDIGVQKQAIRKCGSRCSSCNRVCNFRDPSQPLPKGGTGFGFRL